MDRNDPIYVAAVIDMKALAARARREGKWLHLAYQDIWITPREVEEACAQGKLPWGGTVNFTLRDPEEGYASRRRDEDVARDAVYSFRARIAAERGR